MKHLCSALYSRCNLTAYGWEVLVNGAHLHLQSRKQAIHFMEGVSPLLGHSPGIRVPAPLALRC